MRKQSKSGAGRALAVLAAAGGLWAWKNRDKIRGYVEQQRTQMQANRSSRPTSEAGPAFTGETRRIDESMHERASEPELGRRIGTTDPSI
jgi:hypothetical protein